MTRYGVDAIAKKEYRIIPKINPGLVFRQSTFLGLFSKGLFFGVVFFWDDIRVKKGDGLIIEGYMSATVTNKIRIILLYRITSN